MIPWIVFLITLAVFILSVVVDKRAFRNVFLMLISIFFFLYAVLFTDTANTFLRTAVTWAVILAGIAVLIMPLVFVIAGVITIKKEGFSLAHSLSILFAAVIWGAFIFVVLSLAMGQLPMALISLIILVTIMLVYVLATFMGFLIYSELCLILPRRKKCDFVIIHGAGLLHGTEVTPLLAARINKAVEVYKRSGPGTKLIASGGQGGDEKVSEASAMKTYLLAQGIPEEDILIEDQSKNTWQNLRFSKEIIDRMTAGTGAAEVSGAAGTGAPAEAKRKREAPRVIFVTNNYHVFRTGFYAHKQHIKAAGVGCRTALYYWPNAFVREYIAIITREKAVPIFLFCIWLLGLIVSLLPNM
ncbi:MAG TPA: YdcF family protein [Lachnospiraceae bacterium]|jgi:uncharacterized SAM-binding protein YcdF (DUF218 family)|nr:YdcF family protein [Lachnospiraceae bacterium]